MSQILNARSEDVLTIAEYQKNPDLYWSRDYYLRFDYEYNYPPLHDPCWLRWLEREQIKEENNHRRNCKVTESEKQERLIKRNTVLRGRILDYCNRFRVGSYHRHVKDKPLNLASLR